MPSNNPVLLVRTAWDAPFKNGGVTAPGQLNGAMPTGYDPAYGGIPGVPDPTTSQASTLTGNLSNMDSISKLAAMLTKLNAGNASSAIGANLPGYNGMLSKSSGNIQDELNGTIPQDVMSLINQQGAERGIATGMGAGSDNGNASLLRAMGLTSLNLKHQGEQDLTNAIGRTPTGAPVNPQSMLLDPNSMQEWKYLANMLSAAPQPGAAAAANRNSLLGAMNFGNNNTGGRNNLLDSLFPKQPPRDMSWFYKPLATGGNGQSPGDDGTYDMSGMGHYEGNQWVWNDQPTSDPAGEMDNGNGWGGAQFADNGDGEYDMGEYYW